jgi:hypothetical protein
MSKETQNLYNYNYQPVSSFFYKTSKKYGNWFFSENIKYFSDKFDANWLISFVFLAQKMENFKNMTFQKWTIVIHELKANIVVLNKQNKVIYEKVFYDVVIPKGVLIIYLIDNILLMENEYEEFF